MPSRPLLPPADLSRRVPVPGGGAVHVEVHGDGPPTVLLGGLGSDASLWVCQVEALRDRLRLIVPEHRGAGRSEDPTAPYPIEALADDVAEVLDALGIARAHVVGASMGGFVAQAFALRHPDRLARLVLCCTTFGGPQSVLPAPEVLAALVTREADPAANVRRLYRLFAAEPWLTTHAALVEALVAWRLAHPMSPVAFQWQAAAAAGFDSSAHLARITAPTLLLFGRTDRVVPIENAALMQAALPHAKLRLFDGGHVFFMEHAEAVNRTLAAFLASGPATDG